MHFYMHIFVHSSCYLTSVLHEVMITYENFIKIVNGIALAYPECFLMLNTQVRVNILMLAVSHQRKIISLPLILFNAIGSCFFMVTLNLQNQDVFLCHNMYFFFPPFMCVSGNTFTKSYLLHFLANVLCTASLSLSQKEIKSVGFHTDSMYKNSNYYKVVCLKEFVLWKIACILSDLHLCQLVPYLCHSWWTCCGKVTLPAVLGMESSLEEQHQCEHKQ